MKSHVTCRLISFGEDDFKSYWFACRWLFDIFFETTRQNTKVGDRKLGQRIFLSSSSSSFDLPLTQNHKWWDWKDIAMSSSLRTTKPCAQCLAAIRARRPAEIATSIAGPSNYQEHIAGYSSSKRTSTSSSSLRGNSYKVRNLPKTVKTTIWLVSSVQLGIISQGKYKTPILSILTLPAVPLQLHMIWLLHHYYEVMQQKSQHIQLLGHRNVRPMWQDTIHHAKEIQGTRLKASGCTKYVSQTF